MLIEGRTGMWEAVIGLEIHAQITSKSKLFSSSPTTFGEEQNTQVSFFDCAMPGMLPVLNKKCIEQTVRTGLGLGSTINKFSLFARKNYFYPDLPQGYQISQFNHPIVTGGRITLNMDSVTRNINLTRIHIEQDAGKSLHDQSPTETFIDLNRSGIALMEIVTEPDMRSSAEAAEFLKKLRAILRYLGTCDGDMEKGSLRCDANVSIRRAGSENFGTRVEIKNLNSIKNLTKAIEYELKRQLELLEDEKTPIIQETRLFDSSNGTTRSMRNKEDATDYRYFPEPDLPPLILTQQYIDQINSTLIELPDQKRERYINTLGLSHYEADVIVLDKEVAKYFEIVIEKAPYPKKASNWIVVELFGLLNKANISSITECNVTPQYMSDLINLVENATISGKIAKYVLEKILITGDSPNVIIKNEGLVQIRDTKIIEEAIDKLIQEHESSVYDYLSGKDKLFGFFVGTIMKYTKGKADPSIVNEILKEKLNLLKNKSQ